MHRLAVFTLALMANPSATLAQAHVPLEPITVESYYRIKWGAADEFTSFLLRCRPVDILRSAALFPMVASPARAGSGRGAMALRHVRAGA